MKIRILISMIALLATVAQTTVMLGAAYGFADKGRPLHAVVVEKNANHVTLLPLSKPAKAAAA